MLWLLFISSDDIELEKIDILSNKDDNDSKKIKSEV